MTNCYYRRRSPRYHYGIEHNLGLNDWECYAQIAELWNKDDVGDLAVVKPHVAHATITEIWNKTDVLSLFKTWLSNSQLERTEFA